MFIALHHQGPNWAIFHSGFCEIQYHLPVVSVSLYRETNHYALQVSSSYNSVVFPVPGSISDQYTRLSPIWPRESGVRLPARETSGFVSDLIQWVLLARRTFRKVTHQRIMHHASAHAIVCQLLYNKCHHAIQVAWMSK